MDYFPFLEMFVYRSVALLYICIDDQVLSIMYSMEGILNL
jgi:hypothetical protein